MPELIRYHTPDFTPAAPYPWQDDAACIGEDPEIFFPQVGDIRTSVMAREICESCPVIKECLELGMGFETFGIFGGLTPRGRRNLAAEQEAS